MGSLFDKGEFFYGSSSAFAIAEKVQGNKTHFVVCSTNAIAEKISVDLRAVTGGQVLFLPGLDTLPYDTDSPHPSIRGQRMSVFSELSSLRGDGERRFVVTSEEEALRVIQGRDFFLSRTRYFEVGEEADIDSLENWLVQSGYEKQYLEIGSPGEYSINNSVIDLFAVNSKNPVRIFIDNGVIDSIHVISINTLRNREPVGSTKVVASYEFPLDTGSLSRVKSFLRSQDRFSRNDPVFSALQNGFIPGGLEYFLALFDGSGFCVADLVDQGDRGTLSFVSGGGSKGAFFDTVRQRFDDVLMDYERSGPVSPDEAWFSWSDIEGRFPQSYAFVVSNHQVSSGITANGIERQPRLNDVLKNILSQRNSGEKLVFCVSSDKRIKEVEVISEMMGLNPSHIKSFSSVEYLPESSILKGGINEGFKVEGEVIVITEKEIYGNSAQVFATQKWQIKKTDINKINDLESLSHKDPLVHIEHGVGRYQGVEVVGGSSEMLKIEYADNAISFVPTEDFHMVNRYGGLESNKVPIDVMGSTKWLNRLNAAIKEIYEAADYLVGIKNKRNSIHSFSCAKPSWRYHRFSNNFEFDLTEDQFEAVNEVLSDLQVEKPMDRLIVGDVGFGKTEVAMRGAFLASENNKNVVVIAPTKVLCEQHYKTFLERFKDTNVKVVMPDGTSQRIKNETKRLLSSSGDSSSIVIGTQSVLRGIDQDSSVGLLVIDEEHRFGTQDKERLSGLHGSINILNMTATPIPRTLSLSLNGIKDISVIATPPSRRLSVKTDVKKPSDRVYYEAIQREILRGGQVFLLHNNVSNLKERESYIQSLGLGLSTGILHGGMDSEDQITTINSFKRGEIDVLVCTTIIETGIDVPNANTVLIELPDRLGLSQLHQIRGRVGRSYRQAYCYLIVDDSMGDIAQGRFKALMEAKNLGDGFLLANHDLEIRGAGELLGDKQSGQISKIGFSLYSRLLQRAIDYTEKGYERISLLSEDQKVDMNMGVDAYIDPSYIEKEPLRIMYYKRLSSATSVPDVDDAASEISERFGPLPKETWYLVLVSKLRVFARGYGIKKVVAENGSGYIAAGKLLSDSVIELALSEYCDSYSQVNGGYRFYCDMETVEDRFIALVNIMRLIQKYNISQD